MEHSITSILSIIGALNIFVLGYLAQQIRTLGSKMEYLVKDPTCKERKEQCSAEINARLADLKDMNRELWAAFHNHSHTNLDPKSKVIRT
jgi:hypothetical protein